MFIPRLLATALLCVLVAAPAAARQKKDDAEQVLDREAKMTLSTYGKARFDMTKNPRPYVVVLILDEKDNRYASFWSGKNEKGQMQFKQEMDIFGESCTISSNTSFTMAITNSADKYGMADVIPGGQWMETVHKDPMRIMINGIQDAVFTRSYERKVITGKSVSGTTMSVEFKGKCTGTITIGKRKAPWEGSIVLTLLGGSPAFTVKSVFDFPGNKLGIPGERGRNITATLYTMSASTLLKPKIDLDNSLDSIDSLLD